MAQHDVFLADCPARTTLGLVADAWSVVVVFGLGRGVASQERCKWRRGAAPWLSMLGRVGGGLVDLLGVSADRGGWVEELAA
jgi:hypothetical protein